MAVFVVDAKAMVDYAARGEQQHVEPDLPLEHCARHQTAHSPLELNAELQGCP